MARGGTPTVQAAATIRPSPTVRRPSGSTRVYATAYLDRGKAYRNKGDLDKAIADYTEAIRLNPKLTGAFGCRGLAFEKRGDFNQAIADFTEAIRLGPTLSVGPYDRGEAYSKKGDLDKAIADYTEAIRLDPEMATAYHGRGLAYSRKGEYVKADNDFAQAKKAWLQGKVGSVASPGTLCSRLIPDTAWCPFHQVLAARCRPPVANGEAFSPAQIS